MAQMRVAAIVPVYNRAGMVLEALESIASQARRPDRVVVVDDGSTDGTGDAVERWARESARGLAVRLIRQVNQGVSAARNRAAQEVNDCELIAFLDSDDLWPADYLKRMTRPLETAPSVVAASCDQNLTDGATGELTFIDQSMFDGAVTGLLIEPRMPPLPSATVVRADHFRALGGFDPSYAISQDRHFFLRLSLLGPWRYVPGTPITYRWNQASNGGAAQLTERFWTCDERESWWRMAERFLREQGGAQKVALNGWRKRAALEWIRFGARRVRRGQLAEAVACFDHARSLTPMSIKAHRKALKTRVRRWLTERTNRRRRARLTGSLPDQPRIAVVVPVYCRAAVVEESLDSIARQTLRPAKLVIVDDGSTDGTADRVMGWIERHRGEINAVVVRQSNSGAGAARNRGVTEAGACDLLAFLDSDDLWPADYLRRAAAALARQATAVAAHFDLRFVDAVSGAVQYHDQSLYQGWITRLLYDLLWCQTRGDDRFEGQPPPIPSSTVVRAEAFHLAGGFDPQRRLRADIDLDLRLSLLGPWVHVPGEPVVYRRQLAAVHGGAAQLSHDLASIPQRIAGWRLLADFLLRQGRGSGLPRRWLAGELSRITGKTGVKLIKAGQVDAGSQCLGIAAEIEPWFRRLAGRHLRRRLAGIPGPNAVAAAAPSAPVIHDTPDAQARADRPINALDFFHKLVDKHLDKQWGVFIIPIDSQRNDTQTNAQFRQQNLYLGRYAMPYKTIEGWFGYWNILDRAVAEADDGAQFIELGAAWGCATVYLASKIKAAGKNIAHACVDRWPGDADYEKFRENLRLAQVHGRVRAMRMSFEQAARHFEDESLDFIFVDGGHAYEDVKQDITTWWPKLKPGGVMAGDDWCATWPGVERAVRELLSSAGFEPTHFWLARKG